jgi:O-antigen ligase
MAESVLHPDTAQATIPAASARTRPLDVLGVAWIAVWVSGIMGPASSFLPLSPFYLMTAIYSVYFSIRQPLQLVSIATRPFFWVWLGTALISILLYSNAAFGPDSYASMRSRVVFFAGIAGSMVILMSPDARAKLRSAARIVLVVSVSINLLELAVGNIFSETPGRSAGFYQNPNVSASLLTVCIILTLDFTRHTTRGVLWLSFGLLGILSTFSRSGIVFGALLLLSYFILPRGRGSLPAGNRLIVFLGGLFLAVLAAGMTLPFLEISDIGQYQIRSLFGSDLLNDGSVAGRLWGLRNGWREFTEHPWTGVGIGAMNYYTVFTHNAYLAIAVEFGIFALLLYLVILLVPLAKSLVAGWSRAATQLMLLTCIVYWSAFDHNVHVYSAFALAFAAFATDALIEPRMPLGTNGRSEYPDVSRIPGHTTPAPAISTDARESATRSMPPG